MSTHTILDAKGRDRLIEVLASCLPNILVQHRMFLSNTSCFGALEPAEAVLPKNGRVHDLLSSWIDDRPFTRFVQDTLGTELYERDGYTVGDQYEKVTELPDYVDARATATKLVDKFLSLPWRYTLTAEIPKKLADIFVPALDSMPLQLSDDVRLVPAGKELRAAYPLDHPDEARHRSIHSRGMALLFIGAGPQTWSDGGLYLQIECNGYIDRFGSTESAMSAGAALRSLYGLGIALNLLEVKHAYPTSAARQKIIVHKAQGATWVIDGKFQVEEDASRTIGELVTRNLFGTLDTEAKKVAWVRGGLGAIQAAFKGGKRSESILHAARWLFDSHCSSDEALRFVQTMVTMEILFGDAKPNEDIGLGELLRNRCAYSIGTTHDEREGLMKALSEIYSVRSQIVHRGKARLTTHERILLGKLHWMCQRAISAEIRLLRAAQEQRS